MISKSIQEGKGWTKKIETALSPSLSLSIAHTHTHMLLSINTSHLVKLVPHHLLQVGTGGGEERKIILALSQPCINSIMSTASACNTVDSTIPLIALVLPCVH